MTTPDGQSPRSISRDRTQMLVAVNAVLVVLLVVATLGGHNRASAQPTGTQQIRAHGDYSILAPKASNGNTGAVVIIDSANEEIAALDWDKTRRQLVVTGFRDLTTDTEEHIGR